MKGDRFCKECGAKLSTEYVECGSEVCFACWDEYEEMCEDAELLGGYDWYKPD